MTRKSGAVFVASGLAVLALALVPGALAGKGENRGGGPGSGGANGAAISFDPAQVAVGDQYRVNGSGFGADVWVTVGAYFSDTTWWNSQKTDSEGKFSLVFNATSPGQVYHEAKQQGNNNRLRLMATGTLSVAPAP